ncbi:MAG TPA: hypothetical protein VIH49_01785 [Solirubrobacteraceae bacterium]
MTARNVSKERAELLRWTAGIGAVTGESLALRRCTSIASAQAMLTAAARAEQLVRHRPLADRPGLYTITRLGLRAAALYGIEPCRVSAASAQHMIACAHVAAALERRYPGQLVVGERELRKREREAGTPLASVVLRQVGEHGPSMHRPDLVLLPRSGPRLPVAVEVELTIKAPRRLAEICRAWARSRHVEAVLYVAPPAVERALDRAIGAARAGEDVVVVPLDSLGSERPARMGA